MSDHHRKHRPVEASLRSFAREQRHDMPMAEALFWQQVRAGRFRGLKFKRQVPMPPYLIDFACLSARIIVELDGPLHAEETRRRHDARRDARLKQQGYQVLRFSNDLVIGNLGLVLDEVGTAIDAARNPPPSAGEGGPRVSEGRERGATSPDAAFPSPDPLRGPPSPAEGGGL